MAGNDEESGEPSHDWEKEAIDKQRLLLLTCTEALVDVAYEIGDADLDALDGLLIKAKAFCGELQAVIIAFRATIDICVIMPPSFPN